MEPHFLIGQSMYTDDHRRRYGSLLEQPPPPRDRLTVAGEDDCFGRVRWNVHRDLPSTVVLEHPGDKLSRDRARVPGGRSVGLTQVAVDVITCLLLHEIAWK